MQYLRSEKNSLNIQFLGGIFLGHPGPRRRDIPDKNFMQVAFFCCFRQEVAGMSRDLGRDVPDLEKLYARKLWVDFSHPNILSVSSLLSWLSHRRCRHHHYRYNILNFDFPLLFWCRLSIVSNNSGRTQFERGEKDPHPQDFSLTKKTTRFTKGQFRPYEGPKTALLRTFLW